MAINVERHLDGRYAHLDDDGKLVIGEEVVVDTATYASLYDTGLRDVTAVVAPNAGASCVVLARRWAAGAQDLTLLRFLNPDFETWGVLDELPLGWRPGGAQGTPGLDPEDFSDVGTAVLGTDGSFRGLLAGGASTAQLEFLYASAGERPTDPFGTSFS